MTECRHPASHALPDKKGLYCVECGTQIYAIHERPCAECAHFIDVNKILGRTDQASVCTRRLIPTEPGCYMTYKIGADFSAGGPCFVEGNEKTNGPAEPGAV